MGSRAAHERPDVAVTALGDTRQPVRESGCKALRGRVERVPGDEPGTKYPFRSEVLGGERSADFVGCHL